MNFEEQQWSKMRGQCLVEMTLFVPLFFALIAGCIGFLTLISWQEASLQKAMSIRFAMAADADSAEEQSKQVFAILEKLNSPRTELQKSQSLEDLQASPLLPGKIPTYCPESPFRPQAIHEFCFKPDNSEMLAWPKQKFKLAHYSEALKSAAENSQGVRFGLAPVFDKTPYFSTQQRGRWREFISQEKFWLPKDFQNKPSLQTKLQAQVFRARVAQNGFEHSTPPWNLNRDCFYSAQGMECRGIYEARTAGAIQKLFFEQRRISSLAQASACAAEACARAPNPVACAASAMASAAYLRLNGMGEPSICPVTVAAAKGAHQAGKNFLASLTLNKKLSQASGLARNVARSESAAWHLPQIFTLTE